MQVSRKDFIRIGVGTAAGVLVGGSVTGAENSPNPYAGGKENLRYNNPFKQKVEQGWVRGRQVSAIDLGATNVKPDFPISEQYVFIPESAYTEPTTTVEQFEALAKKAVGHQVYATDPSEQGYSPMWHNNWVLVPQGYKANTLKSVAEVEKSSYKIVPTPIWDN